MSLSDPPTRHERLRSRLEELDQRFRARAGEDFEAIKVALANNDHVLLKERAHRLAGTAGSFGFLQIGGAAQLLDELISSQAPASDIEAATHNLLGALHSVRPMT